jgi:hypothetical protein
MSKYLGCGLFLLFVASVVLAQMPVVTTVSGGTNAPTQFSSNVGGLTIGYIKVGSSEVGTLSWHPDIKIGPWGFGADFNFPLGQNPPAGYENGVLRYVEYDDSKKGLRYGIIDNLTWGHGLLMKNYSSRQYGPVIANNEQMALKAYVDQDKYVGRVLGTKSNVYAFRVEERINSMLTLGQSIITDSDGVRPAGTTEVQKVSGYGLDATVPLPLNFEGYAELAGLTEHGNGLSAGVSWAYDLFVANASFLAEYRLIDKKFVPGYFNADYETNPINLASVEAAGTAKNGYLAQFGLNALGLASLNVAYENYNDSSSAALNADLFAKLMQIEATGYYRQPSFSNFRSLTVQEGAVIGGSVAYPVNPFTKLVWNYKQAYNTSTQKIEESQYYELRLSF